MNIPESNLLMTVRLLAKIDQHDFVEAVAAHAAPQRMKIATLMYYSELRNIDFSLPQIVEMLCKGR